MLKIATTVGAKTFVVVLAVLEVASRNFLERVPVISLRVRLVIECRNPELRKAEPVTVAPLAVLSTLVAEAAVGDLEEVEEEGSV